MEDKSAFTFYVNETKNDMEVFFFGELKGPQGFVSEGFKTLVQDIKDAVIERNKPVFLNVHNTTSWDSDGMNNTIGLALKLNAKKQSKMVSIVGPKENSLVYEKAKETFPNVIGNDVLWKRG